MTAAKCIFKLLYEDVSPNCEANNTKLCSCSGNALRFNVFDQDRYLVKQDLYCRCVDAASDLSINDFDIVSNSAIEYVLMLPIVLPPCLVVVLDVRELLVLHDGTGRPENVK